MPHREQEVLGANVHVRIIFFSVNRESIRMCICYFFSTSFETEPHLRLLEAYQRRKVITNAATDPSNCNGDLHATFAGVILGQGL